MSEHVGSVNGDPSLSASAPQGDTTLTGEHLDEPMWYSVIVGRRPGVFHGPDGLTENVIHIPNAIVISHNTEALARDCFRDACIAGRARCVFLEHTRETLTRQHLDQLTPLSSPNHATVTGIVGRWYAIFVGRVPGVYLGRDKIALNTVDIKGQLLHKYENHAEARAAFLAVLDIGQVVRVVYNLSEEVVTSEMALEMA